MAGFLARRLASALLLVYLVLTATFFLLHAAPGKPGLVPEDPRIPAAQRQRLERVYGLDRPLPEQYVRFVAAMARGEWGASFHYHRPVAAVLAEALPATLLLGLAALLVEYGIGVPLGVAAARRAGGLADQAIRVTSLLLYSLPTFWLGLMALLLFAFRWPLLPAGGLAAVDAAQLSPLDRALDLLRHLALPAATLGLPSAAALARFLRASLLEILGQDYIRTARAKGLSEGRALWTHALRNAIAPLTQLFGLSFAFLLSGALAVEVVFAWPGIGRVTYDALVARDYPVVLAATALSAAMVVAGSVVADLLQAWADPRVRDER